MAAAMRRALCYVISIAVILVGSGRDGCGRDATGRYPEVRARSWPLEMSERASARRFINAVGEKSGLWGFEDGQLEGWVYPLKIFHDFQLDFSWKGCHESIPDVKSLPAFGSFRRWCNCNTPPRCLR